MEKVKQVAIVGGTHGNEYSGIYLLKQWQKAPSLIERASFNTEAVFANPKAFTENKRYIDCDLNRQFTATKLADNDRSNYEQSRAKALNIQLGPKGDSRTDFIIDLHNTTSNMGPTLILLQSNQYNKELGAYVLANMADAVIVFEDQKTVSEHYFLSSISPQGVIIEIGPQPQSVIRQDILDYMTEMTGHVLDFIELKNNNEQLILSREYEAYRWVESLKLPEDADGERIGMVHKNVQDNDFKPLKTGDPIFKLFDGSEITYQGDYTAYPHFINEAAYYDNNLAMSLGKKIIITL